MLCRDVSLITYFERRKIGPPIRNSPLAKRRPPMRTGLNLKPGDKGPRRLVDQFGDRLVCERYRYDEERKKVFKTVELIVEEIPSKPRAARGGDHLVGVEVKWDEAELAGQVKRAGERWNRARRVWELRYDRAVELGLEERLAPARDTHGCRRHWLGGICIYMP